MAIKIRFQGTEYWFLGYSFDEAGAVSPLHHCDELGHLLMNGIFEVSYAHWFPDVGLMRYREVIGQLEDITVLDIKGHDLCQ